MNIAEDEFAGDEAPTPVELRRAVRENRAYRRVLRTSSLTQSVAMYLRPGESIGWEMHPETDQYFRVEHGDGVFLRGRRDISRGTPLHARMLNTHTQSGSLDKVIMRARTDGQPTAPCRDGSNRNEAQRIDICHGSAWTVEALTWHDVVAGSRGLSLFTMYAPPHHPRGTVMLEKPL